LPIFSFLEKRIGRMCMPSAIPLKIIEREIIMSVWSTLEFNILPSQRYSVRKHIDEYFEDFEHTKHTHAMPNAMWVEISISESSDQAWKIFREFMDDVYRKVGRLKVNGVIYHISG